MKHKSDFTAKNILRSFWCVLAAVISCGVLSVGAGMLLQSKIISMDRLDITASTIQGISALIACVFSAAKAKERRLLYSGITGVLFFAILILGNRLISQEAMKSILPTGIIIGTAILMGAIIPSAFKKRYHA